MTEWAGSGLFKCTRHIIRQHWEIERSSDSFMYNSLVVNWYLIAFIIAIFADTIGYLWFSKIDRWLIT